jgi:AcrR family transcriptional regulator
MAIAAAELILVRHGYAGLSMRKVADAIGYTVGNLYLLFQNQDELLAIVNERTTDAIYAELHDALDSAGTPELKLRRLAGAYIDFAAAHPHRFRMMFEHQLPEDMKPRPSTEVRIRRMFELVESAVAPALPRASKEKIRLAAATLWSGVHGVCMLAVTGKLAWSGRSDYRPFADLMIGTFLAGLREMSRHRG